MGSKRIGKSGYFMAPLNSRKVLGLLRRYESRNITFIETNGSWPIVWERARGVFVWDTNGRKFLDLSAAFGVAASGHANPRIVGAGREQMNKLLHAMGDVHPHAPKAMLARELSRITFERWNRISSSPRISRHRGKTIFCNSGFEAVEAALKTAMLATGRREIIAFKGAYHGLGYGALNATHRPFFRQRFERQLGRFASFVDYPQHESQLGEIEQSLRREFKRREIGAVLVEPIQGRSGIVIPPLKFLPMLRRLCDEHHALLIVDEIFTGFGRTGRWFACEHSETIPDVICLGKALTGGFPLSACVGRDDVMDAAWPASSGEAIHTSTFLGHPVGCAMALAQIKEVNEKGLVRRSAEMGRTLLHELSRVKSTRNCHVSFRALGLMAGVEMNLKISGKPATLQAIRVVKKMLHLGFIVLPEGQHSNVISLTPPLIMGTRQLLGAIDALALAIRGA